MANLRGARTVSGPRATRDKPPVSRSGQIVKKREVRAVNKRNSSANSEYTPPQVIRKGKLSDITPIK